MLYAKDLKRARRMQGLTQAEAADAIGCCLRAFKNWETGSAEPHRMWRPRIRAFIAARPIEALS